MLSVKPSADDYKNYAVLLVEGKKLAIPVINPATSKAPKPTVAPRSKKKKGKGTRRN